jgi:hypothetical protein
MTENYNGNIKIRETTIHAQETNFYSVNFSDLEFLRAKPTLSANSLKPTKLKTKTVLSKLQT